MGIGDLFLWRGAISSLCKSWERTEDKQPESAAAVGAAIPLIGSCHAV
jgi:hypothetical protein